MQGICPGQCHRSLGWSACRKVLERSSGIQSVTISFVSWSTQFRDYTLLFISNRGKEQDRECWMTGTNEPQHSCSARMTQRTQRETLKT